MTTKLYKHVTNGGAEYLTDTFIEWKHNGKKGKEGRVTEETRVCIRLDGQPEVLRNQAEDDRAELLAALKDLHYAASYTAHDNPALVGAILRAREAIAKAEA